MRLYLLFFFISFSSMSQEIDSISAKKRKEQIIEKGLDAYFSKDKISLGRSIDGLFEIYNKDKDSIVYAKYYHYKALLHKLNYINDSAFYYYHNSKDISKRLRDSLEVGRRWLSIGILQRESKDFLGSEISLIESLKYIEPIKSYKYLVSIYNNLGLVSLELNQKEETLRYYDLSLGTNELTSKSKRKETSYLYIINNIGLLYQKENQHKKALEYFNKGLKFDSIKFKYPSQYALLLENLTFSKSILSQGNLVLEHYEEVLRIRKEEKVFQSISTTHLNIANYYNDKKQLQKAKFHANEALKFAKQTHNNKRWLEALQLLSNLTVGNQSREYLQEYIVLNDSLFDQERRLKNQFAKIRYETEKKEKENTFLKTENYKERQQKTIGWLVSTVFFLFLISSILFFTFRRKKLLFQAQLQKAEVREQERRQIAKSLHDEVAGDLRLLHHKLEKSELLPEAKKLALVKDNVRNLSHQLSSVSFEEVPFKDQIINLVSDYYTPGFIIKVNGLKEYNWFNVNKSIKRLLYLSVRESIQNCQKHAKATKMTIHFSIHKKSVFLDIIDNGVGFDTETHKKGIGLQNLQERVEELNGNLTIESEVKNGTKINIQIPSNA